MTLLTFIIPVRHHANARNWESLRAKLAQTVHSINGQTNSDWRAIIVANEGSDLPDLPPRFAVERVNFPPNERHERQNNANRQEFWDAFRLDKGRRVLAGMLACRESHFYMIVDDDDFVSSSLVQHVADNRDAPGWCVQLGYVWDDGGRLLFATEEFNRMCGTSLIVRSDLYSLPQRFEDASEEWIKTMLGSHRFIADILAERGTPLGPCHFGERYIALRALNRTAVRPAS